MKKPLIIGGAVAGAVAGPVLLAKRRVASPRRFDFEQWIERMPDGAPPKWIFNNVSAIRENTERILHLLESERTSAERPN